MIEYSIDALSYLTLRSDHPEEVFSAMETIMTLVIDESEYVLVELLSPILAPVRKDNKAIIIFSWILFSSSVFIIFIDMVCCLFQNVSPICWRLGEEVVTNCAAKLRPYLMEVVKCLGTRLSDYAPAVATICQNESDTRQNKHHDSGSGEHLVSFL